MSNNSITHAAKQIIDLKTITTRSEACKVLTLLWEDKASVKEDTQVLVSFYDREVPWEETSGELIERETIHPDEQFLSLGRIWHTDSFGQDVCSKIVQIGNVSLKRLHFLSLTPADREKQFHHGLI